jgi:hypothetical protein
LILFVENVPQIISEKLPYDEIEDRFVMPAIAQGRLPGKPDGGAGYGMSKTSLPWRLAERCWKPRPNERPTCREVHAFFTRECQISEEPECTDEAVSEARHRFWEGDKKRPKVEVNWSYVHFLLGEVGKMYYASDRFLIFNATRCRLQLSERSLE